MLLAKLHMDALEPQVTRSGLKEVLDNLPRDLESAFKDTLDRINKQPDPQKLLARRALMWVVGARRPLTIGELRCAVALKLESQNFSSEDQPSESTIISVCAGLLIVDRSDEFAWREEGSNAVRLTRKLQTAGDFFEMRFSNESSDTTVQEHFDHIKSQYFENMEYILASSCLKYLHGLICNNMVDDGEGSHISLCTH